MHANPLSRRWGARPPTLVLALSIALIWSASARAQIAPVASSADTPGAGLVAVPDPLTVTSKGRAARAAAGGRPGGGADPDLTLAEVIGLAGARDPGRFEVEARRAEGRALRSASRRWLNGPPVVSGMYLTDSVDDRDDGYREWNSGLSLPLWWPGQVSPRRRTAEAASAAAEEATAAQALAVAGRIRAALSDLAMGTARLDRARADLEAEAAFAARMERAVALGEIAERELLLVRGAVVECELAEVEAREELEHARATWLLLTGLERWPAAWRESLHPTARLEVHPLLRLARQDVAQAEANAMRIERSSWGAPNLTLGTQHERPTRADDWDHRLVAGLTIPVGRQDPIASGEIAAHRTAAQMRRDAARLQRELQARQLHNEHRLDLARARIENTARHRALAAEHLDRVERGFALGEVDLTTLVEARSRARQALWAEREAELLHDILIGEANQALGVVP